MNEIFVQIKRRTLLNLNFYVFCWFKLAYLQLFCLLIRITCIVSWVWLSW